MWSFNPFGPWLWIEQEVANGYRRAASQGKSDPAQGANNGAGAKGGATPTKKPTKVTNQETGESVIQVGEIIMWRMWRTWPSTTSSNGQPILRSWAVEINWQPGQPMNLRRGAEVLGYEYGAAIAPGNNIGVWSLTEEALKKKLIESVDYNRAHSVVWGKVAIWGDVLVGTRGYRSEYARVISFEGGIVSEAELEKLRKLYCPQGDGDATSK